MVTVGRYGRTQIVAGAVDRGPEILQRSPRVERAVALRDVDVLAAEPVGTRRDDEQTQIVLGNEGAAFRRGGIHEGSEILRCSPRRIVLGRHRQRDRDNCESDRSDAPIRHMFPPLVVASLHPGGNIRRRHVRVTGTIQEIRRVFPGRP